ncbi:MAG: signal peptide peptidase SppA [Gammaproteobacteria bacterium]|nr:signal peptide peptidase SppA [Gammaproteobacteria bacterium]
MTTPASTLGKFFAGLTKVYRGFRSVILNLLFIVLLLILVGSFIGQPAVIVEKGSALLLNPKGALVDQLTYINPLDALVADSVGTDLNNEILLRDVLNAIELAGNDEDISSIVLSLSNLQPSGFSKLQEIGIALTTFRQSGKKVYAYADNYSQGQYYLASHADEIILNPMGSVNIEGFSTYQTYYKDALDKLGINVHIFRVGEYKSAVEPFERNDMSSAAREANQEWLGDLWQHYVSGVAIARGIEPEFINDFINTLDQHLAEFNGDMASLVLDRNLVDQLLDRGEANDYLKNEIGAADNDEDFLYIALENYLAARNDQLNTLQENSGKIGLIVASGTIYDGPRNAGEIGGDSLQELIRRAREDDTIKALVLRIDSGGGSAFASEVIRSELEMLQDAGKPLVVSMGSVAASGGYWIATPADEIWASPSTITGSIGIFGLYPTFENSFDKLGLNTDGLGTTDLAGALNIGRELPELAENVLQSMLEDGYNRFINLVANARNLSLEEVDAIAQGRVWSGEDAHTLGLVDNLGNLDEAIASAASLAGLSEYSAQMVEQPLSPGQQLIQDLTNNVLIKVFQTRQQVFVTPTNILSDFYSTLNNDLQALLKFNDPNAMYLHCQECMPMLSK